MRLPRTRIDRPSPNGPRWVATSAGVWVPVLPDVAPRTVATYADTMRRFSKITLTSKEIFGEKPDRSLVEALLTSGPVRFTLGVLSRMGLTLADGTYAEMPQLQLGLARGLLPQSALERIDEWRLTHPSEPDMYLFGEQHLLAAMTVVLLKAKRRRLRRPQGPPFTNLGTALAHVAGFLDPLEYVPDFHRLPHEDARRPITEMILRNGIFYDHEAFQNMISRYYEMFCRVAPTLAAHADYMDIPAAFQRASGLKLPTYLRLGVALLASIKAVAADRQGPALLNLERLRPPRHLSKTWRKFSKEVMTTPGGYRRLHRAHLRLSPITEYNFLAAERYPIVALSKKVGCCLSLPLLERKFGIGVMHRLQEGMSEDESARFRRFLGRVFERYVQDICLRTFGDLFVPGFEYDGKEAGDGWVVYPPNAVLLEAKSGFLQLETALSGRFEGFERAFRQTLLAGAHQLTRVIDDFRAGRFTVQELGPGELKIIYPVIVNLRYVPLEKFLWQYIRSEVGAAGLLTQEAVRPLTIMAVKDLEIIEGFGGRFLGLLQRRLEDPGWQDLSFSNFLFFTQRGAEGFPPNQYLIERYRELLSGGARQIFHAALKPASASD